MAWVKVPAENHPLFKAALPKDPRVSTLNMFGGVAAMVHGNIFGGLFGRAAIVKLSPEDQTAALALDGAEPFDPMGNGRVMTNTVFLPETIMDEPGELRDWLRKAFEYIATLPPKQKKPTKAKSAAKATPAPKAKPAAKTKPAAKKPAAKARAKSKSKSKSSKRASR